MTGLTLKILKKSYTIHRLNPSSSIPMQLAGSGFYSITQTDDELSIVCNSELEIASDKSEEGWICIKVLGPLDFSLTGILAKLSAILAEKGISIFAISTFDTDYILLKSADLPLARESLLDNDYQFIDSE